MATFPYHVGDSALCTSHKFGAFRGKLEPQIKTAPAVRQHCDSGASPTIEESTDG